MKWEFDNDRPIYIQLVEGLTLAIVTGEFEKGAKIPSVRNFANTLKVNPNTMQKALSELEESGLIRTERTSGRFVTDDSKKIETVKDALAYQKSIFYISQMKMLGFTKEKAVAYLERKEFKE